MKPFLELYSHEDLINECSNCDNSHAILIALTSWECAYVARLIYGYALSYIL